MTTTEKTYDQIVGVIGFDQDPVLALAARFAHDAHAKVGQLRKYTNDPYIIHPVAVARLVMTVTDDVPTIAAALLHDTDEDTEATLADIQALFGDDIASMVENLTDVSRPGDGNRATRKEIDRQHIASADPRAKTVKLADLIHNTASIVEHDLDFARIYLAEKALLLEVLTEGHPTLYALAQKTLQEGQSALLQRALRTNSSIALQP